jgi:transposase InsO family protein
MDDQDQTWTIFWCSLFSPLLFGEVPEDQAQRFLRKLAQQEHLFPDGRRKKASLSTLKRKWRQYRQGGFAALARKRRCDRGRPRKRRGAMIDKAVELKKDQPRRSERTINEFLLAQFQDTVPASTLYRHLKQAGATRLKLDVTGRPVRCRWSREQTNALWLGDFQDGPYVLCDGQAVPTHLSAFIDCYSRFAVEARYYRRENLDILIDSLLRAWAKHGASRELYLDNAKIYHARALQAACFQLNIRLLHRGVGDPPPGGLM